eukprot:TRINITY_DN89792_c0_g1_i1.p1 TRINITY_DN89792_c0_g1~~TRINITY_DN89792_c0_g1_i1.p1  ORF type:complete len:427 (-),score=95.69 TRINITY_DN89792_c0_g1_i1:57-1337(-)
MGAADEDGNGAAEKTASDPEAAAFENFQALLEGEEGVSEQRRPAVLVLGGSKFMGKALVDDLLDQKAKICVVNRGRKHWGSSYPSAGKTARVLADREEPELFARRLREATRRLGRAWDMVVDFSAFDGNDMRASLDGLGANFKLYVYISSDSIYEVSAWAAAKWKPNESHTGEEIVVTEDLAVRPTDPSEQRALNKKDDYGHGKLVGEEVLRERLPPGCRCLFVRLPDVIGPFDATFRLWAYWHWLRAGELGTPPPQVQAYKPKKRQREAGGSEQSKRQRQLPPEDPVLAVVFSQDVARFCASLLNRPWPREEPCDAVNVGCLEQVQLCELLCRLARTSGCQRARPRLQPVKDPKTFLPSVDRPWPLCFARAKEVYGFEPTPLDTVLERCEAFFREGCELFPDEAKRAAKKLPEEAADMALKLLEG